MKNKMIILLGFFISSLAISCNSDEKKADNNSASSSNPTVGAGQSAVQDDVSAKNVVQVAMGSKDHTTLVTAVKAADLVDVLSNAGPFTVFAPTNAAFDKLAPGTVDGLLKPEKKADLQDILQYHVSVGVFKEDAFQDGQVIGQVRIPSTSSTSCKSSSGSRPGRSILLTKVKIGIPRRRQTWNSFLVWASTPLAESISITAASAAARVR